MLGLFGSLSWNWAGTREALGAASQQAVRVAELQGAIASFEKWLTLSAHMAAAMGEARRIARYDIDEPGCMDHAGIVEAAERGWETSGGVVRYGKRHLPKSRGSRAMHPMDQEMRRCVDACLDCHRVCITMASQHCLDVGGLHVEPRHFRLMLACAEICRTSAYFMELGTELHKRTCAVCAEVCETCAEDCARLGDMDECVAACRTCASACRSMAA